jgi:N-glycosyltransferase
VPSCCNEDRKYHYCYSTTRNPVLFPHCDLFITHSPFATMMAALSYGVPLLITPFTGESPIGARRAHELEFGLALRLQGHSSPLLSADMPLLSPETVRASCRELIGNPKYRANARRIQQELDTIPGPKHAVALLEQFVATAVVETLYVLRSTSCD